MWSIGFGGSAGGFRGTSLAVLNDSFWLRAKNWGHTTERWRKRGNGSAYLCVVDRSRGKGQPDTNTPYFHHSDVVFLVFFDTSLLQEIFIHPFVSQYAFFFKFAERIRWCFLFFLFFFINPFFFFFLAKLLPDELNLHHILFIFSSVFDCLHLALPMSHPLFFFLCSTQKKHKKKGKQTKRTSFALACQNEPSYFVTCENPI